MDEELRREALAAVRAAPELLFVCSGNMVRSAFAELYARHLGVTRPMRSLATTYRNDRIFPETAEALLRRGVERVAVEGFRPTHLEDMRPGPRIGACFLAMRQGHLDDLSGHLEVGRGFLLPAVVGSRAEIADPVLEGADFGETFAEVARCVEALAVALRGTRA